MSRRALSGFLQDFSGRPSSAGEAKHDKAELARLAGRAEALQEAQLAQEQILQEFALRQVRDLAEARESWVRSEAMRIDEQLAEIRRGLSAELSALVADCLRPFLQTVVREAAVLAFADQMNGLLAKGGAAALTISGPPDLLAALAERLGPPAAQCVFVESERVALEASLAGSVVASRLDEWLRAFASRES